MHQHRHGRAGACQVAHTWRIGEHREPAYSRNVRRRHVNARAEAFRLRHGGEVLTFMSTTMVFGTPVDVTLSELALETFFPADELTAQRMREIAASLN